MQNKINFLDDQSNQLDDPMKYLDDISHIIADRILEKYYERTNSELDSSEPILTRTYSKQINQNSSRSVNEILSQMKEYIKEKNIKIENASQILSKIYQNASKLVKDSICKHKNNLANLAKEKFADQITLMEQRHPADLVNCIFSSNPHLAKNAFLWVAKKEGCAPIYIFNTLHLLTIDPDRIFGTIIKNIIDKVDIVRTEVETKNPNYKISQKKFNFEQYIVNCVNQASKILKVMENDEVIDISGVDYVGSLPSDDELNLVTLNYLTHVVASENVNSEKCRKKFGIDKRNKFWLHGILQDSIRGISQLVVCGALHSVNRWGLPTLLTCEGYTVTPLMERIPYLNLKTLNQFSERLNSNFFSRKKIFSNLSTLNSDNKLEIVLRQQRNFC